MDTMLIREAPGLPSVLKFDSLPPLQTASGTFRVGFQNQGAQTTLCQVQSGCQPGHTCPDDNNLMRGDLIGQNGDLVSQ